MSALFQQTATYDFKQVILTVANLRVGGFDEEGGVAFEMAADIGESSVGLGGEVVWSRSNDERVFVDITLMESSRSYRDLDALLKLQQEQNPILPLPFVMRDNISGETVTSEYAIFVTRPAPNKNRQSGTRVFRLLLPNAAKKIFAAS
jgi:uncharacterized protein YkvS